MPSPRSGKEPSRPILLRTYGHLARTSRTWNGVMRGKIPGLERQAREILREFLIYAGDLDERYGGKMPRARFCAALGISIMSQGFQCCQRCPCSQ